MAIVLGLGESGRGYGWDGDEWKGMGCGIGVVGQNSTLKITPQLCSKRDK